MIVIKADLGGDVRRFTLETANLDTLLDTIYHLYQINSGSSTLYLSYSPDGSTDAKAPLLPISSNDQLQQAIQNAKNNILRITVKKDEVRSKPKQDTSSPTEPIKKPFAPQASPSNKVVTETNNAPLTAPSAPPPSSPLSSSSLSTPSAPAAASANANNNNNPTAPSSTTENINATVEQIIAHPLFQQKLKETVTRTVFSAPFVNLLSQAMLPSLQSLIDNAVRKQLAQPKEQENEGVVSKPTASKSTSTDNAVNSNNQAVNIPVQAPPKKQQEQENNPVQVPQPIREAKPEEKPLPENVNNNIKEEAKPVKEDIKPEEAVQPEEESEPDSFVIVNQSANNQEEVSNNGSPKPPLLVQSILDFFAGKKSLISSNLNAINQAPREQPNPEEEKVDIPNLEDILRQLADMGFTDRDTNMKVLRFHTKFHEGLDEVVEDLLIQSTTNEKPPANKA